MSAAFLHSYATLVASLIAAYQGWSGEKIMSGDRAEQVTKDMLLLYGLPTKVAATSWLEREGWSDTKAGRNRLVKAVWDLKAGKK